LLSIKENKERSFLVNEVQTIKYFYEIIYIINNNKISKNIEDLANHLKKTYPFDIPLDYSLKSLDDTLKKIENYFQLIYFDEDNKLYKPTLQDFTFKEIDRNRFNLILLKYIHQSNCGKWGVFNRNSFFTLFISFLLENNILNISLYKNEKNKSMKFKKEIDNFLNFLKKYNAIPKVDKDKEYRWNYMKFNNLLTILNDLGILTKHDNSYYVMGNYKFNNLLMNDIINLIQKSPSFKKYISLEDFFRIIEDNYFFLTFLHIENLHVPILIEKFLLRLLNQNKIKLLNSSDYKRFRFDDGKEFNHIEIINE